MSTTPMHWCATSLAALPLLLIASPGQAQTSAGPTLTRVRDLAYAWYDVPAGHQLGVRVTPQFSTGNLTRAIQCRGIAITGAYTSRTRRGPDGLVVVSGQVLGRDNGRPDGGVITLHGSSLSMERANDFRARVKSQGGLIGNLVYSQPILISDGKVDRGLRRRERANRVALGRYREGRSFMVMAYNTDRSGLSAVALGQFATDVLAITKRPIEWLINLDGGPSAFMYNASGSSMSPGRGKVTSYICAEPSSGK